jgi:hypothetical protein
MAENEKDPYASYVRLDAAASQVVGGGIVVNKRGELVAEFDTIDEALAYVAKANGETEEKAIETAKAFSQYLWNLRNNKKVDP